MSSLMFSLKQVTRYMDKTGLSQHYDAIDIWNHMDSWRRLGPNQMGKPCGRGWVGLRGACQRSKHHGGDKAATLKASKLALADKIRKKKGMGDRNAVKPKAVESKPAAKKQSKIYDWIKKQSITSNKDYLREIQSNLETLQESLSTGKAVPKTPGITQHKSGYIVVDRDFALPDIRGSDANTKEGRWVSGGGSSRDTLAEAAKSIDGLSSHNPFTTIIKKSKNGSGGYKYNYLYFFPYQEKQSGAKS